MSNGEFKIDLAEEFEYLAGAPIVEAVIHWRATPSKKLDPTVLLKELKERLPDYPDPQRQQDARLTGEFSPDGTSIQFQRNNWYGFGLESHDKLYVAQFTRNGFMFSRLKPYQNWERFEEEALRLWKIYCELADPCEIQRLGVRFINLISPIRPEKLNDLLVVPPLSPDNMQLPLKAFMHQNTFDIPGHPYNLNVIQTIRPPSPPETEAFGLILDLDVFTTQTSQINDEEIKDRLLKMRWIKNKAFFTFLKGATIAQFKEEGR